MCHSVATAVEPERMHDTTQSRATTEAIAATGDGRPHRDVVGRNHTRRSCQVVHSAGVEGGDGLRTTPRQWRSLQAAVTGPGRGPNAAARNAIYATCPKPVRLPGWPHMH